MDRKLIIGIDFDGTLCAHKYPEIGEAFDAVVERVRSFKRAGHRLILYTCRNGKELQEAVEWCKDKGIEFDAVNDDIDEIKNSDFYRGKSIKVYADFYLDDRNISLKDLWNIMI